MQLEQTIAEVARCVCGHVVSPVTDHQEHVAVLIHRWRPPRHPDTAMCTRVRRGRIISGCTGEFRVAVWCRHQRSGLRKPTILVPVRCHPATIWKIVGVASPRDDDLAVRQRQTRPLIVEVGHERNPGSIHLDIVRAPFKIGTGSQVERVQPKRNKLIQGRPNPRNDKDDPARTIYYRRAYRSDVATHVRTGVG